jgi:DNA-binding response OmpR family regulator
MPIAEIQRKPWVYVLDEPMRVLVADDDPILREFATVHLASPCATIETAADGNAALEMLKTGNFDVALLDIEMPGLGGFTVLEKIRAEPKLRHLPVMMLTGHEDIASVDRAYDLGANAFVTKPVNWRLLSYRIRYVLRNSRVERQLRQARELTQADDPVSSLETFAEEHDMILNAIVDEARALRAASAASSVLLEGLDRIEAQARAALSHCGTVRHALRATRPSDTATEQISAGETANVA